MTENTGLDTDLATLRLCLTPGVYKVPIESLAALDRVEAEIARLETERDQWQMHNTEAYERALAAEARERRLRDGLRRMFDVAAVAHNGDPWYCEHEGIEVGPIFAEARALLAEEPV